ncbi:MAG: hypothetical protein WC769_05040 [Thermodesulfovibrionales bacterium]
MKPFSIQYDQSTNISVVQVDWCSMKPFSIQYDLCGDAGFCARFSM